MHAGRWSIVALVAVVAIGLAHNVPKQPTEEDVAYIRAMMDESAGGQHSSSPASFEEELDLIFAVQDAVLNASPKSEPLPAGVLREPRQLYEAGHGWCFDRSRSIEKGLEYFGLTVRHISIFELSKTGSALLSLLVPQTRSHALTEVRTLRGWVVVDSNRRWVAVDSAGDVWSIAELQEVANAGLAFPEWSERIDVEMVDNFQSPITYVFGLYSRHGQFFPPFTPLPDVNWWDLVVSNLAR